MRRSLLPFFPLIGLVLMGNSCDFAARVGTPPPPRDAERPVEGDGGLLVVVCSGDTSALGEAQSSVAAEALVATALFMSALSVPEAATVVWSSSPTGLRPLARTEPVVAIAAPMAGRRPVVQ